MTKLVASISTHDALDARERILYAARYRFAEQGFAASSVRVIAEEADVAKPMVFYYFESKAGLFDAVAQSTIGELNRRYTAVFEGPRTSAFDALVALARAHRDVAINDSVSIRFLTRCVLGSGTPYGETLRRDHLSAIDHILDAARDEGAVVRDREAARQLCRGALSIFYMDAVSGTHLSSADPQQLAEMLWRAIIALRET
ncbi:MAG: TetR/AcrR family transcriptional regulator [Myxococcota bacterium]